MQPRSSFIHVPVFQHSVQNRLAPGWLLQEGRLCPTGSLFATLRTDAAVAASAKKGDSLLTFYGAIFLLAWSGGVSFFLSPVMLPNLSCNAAPPSC